jgi:Probable lipoprotein LpqN
MAIGARTAALVVGATAIVLVTGCTRTIEDARVVAAPDMGKARADASACKHVDAPLTKVPFRVDDEPVMKIPQPDGWERVTMMDSELIRFTMRDPKLAKDNFAPTAVVTLENQPGEHDPQEVFDAQHEVLQSGVGATDLKSEPTTLCGLRAEILDYTTPPIGPIAPHPARVMCAVMQTNEKTFAMTLTVQTADPDNPAYQRDAETILTGFQMLPPASS